MVGGEGGRQLSDDLAPGSSGTPPGRNLGGGDIRIATPRDGTIVLPVDTYDRGSGCAEHARFPRTLGI